MRTVDFSYSFSQVPYIEDRILDDYAFQVLNEHIPDILRSPTAVDIERFMEYDLNLTVEYKLLSIDHRILGLTAFNTGYIQIYDEDTLVPYPLLVKEGTVLIDNSLLTKRNMKRLRFTMAHEAAHWLLHRKYFSADNPFLQGNRYEYQYVAAKEGRIDYRRHQLERNDSERIEYQADSMASCLLMPIDPLRRAFVSFFRFYYAKPCKIIRGSCLEHDMYAKQLPEYISKIFNVSKQAAKIRLERLGAIR